jgi:NAD+ synthase (glutamine-hydrolysing)
MAQVNSTVGDLKGNVAKIAQFIADAKQRSVDLVFFPELAVTGYPPQDLLLERDFVEENKELLKQLVKNTYDIAGVIGFVDYEGKNLFNAAAVFAENRIVGIVHKTLLPTYDVFDEERYFKRGNEHEIAPVEVEIGGKQIALGVEICEDLWDESYPIKVTEQLAKKRADLIVNISSSPFYSGKAFERQKLLQENAQKHNRPIFYVNLVGGQDELVFDGQSMAVSDLGKLIALGKQFDEDLIITNLDQTTCIRTREIESPPYLREKEMFNAIVLGIRDYFAKSGFKKSVIGLSGGIDSSLSACIAVEALGKENVIGVSMPSKFSSDHSKTDAQKLAENLEICFVHLEIQEIVDSYQKNLKMPLQQIRHHFKIDSKRDDPVADENLQPRTRGNCLMDIANRLKVLKILVINTGNKTELALGYCTLYGDMAGGIGALGDVSKLEVYELAKYVNEKAKIDIIPQGVFLKKPSPELKDNQFDPFDFSVISPLVDEIIENKRSRSELVAMGYPNETVENVYRRIRNSEYKRRQAVPCVKITPKAFGIGRKMPIVNKF